MIQKRILITGGSGMVGKSLKQIIPNATCLSSKDCDLRNRQDALNVMRHYNPDVIVHLAARVGGIIDNIKYPVQYFNDNILMNTNVLDCAHELGITRVISALSTCAYPDVALEYPMKEDFLHSGPPTKTNFSYGYAKRCLLVQSENYNQQYGTKFQCLIPCNMYGEHDKYGENSHFVAALLKKIISAKKTGVNKLELFGTGKPLRQFMHSDDFAYVIKACIDRDIYDNMNVATDEVLSIREMAEIAKIVCEADHLNIEYNSQYPDGQYRKDVSIDFLRKKIQDFEPIKFKDGVKRTYQHLMSQNS